MLPATAPAFRRHAVAWLVLLLAALAGVYGWWQIGRPVALPDAPSGRISCVSYAPFRMAGETPLDPKAFISPERIDADLRALSQRFDCVRTYSQGQGLSAVPKIAQRYGMQVLLGIWLGGDAKANAEQVRLGIATARSYPQVLRGVVVGNEVLLRGELSSAQVAGYLQQVRAAVKVPVTYADVWEFWLRHPELASSVDFITIHILPYWEDQPVPPERALQHVATVYAKVQQAFPGRRLMIGETGWPSAGRSRHGVSATVVNEARYLRGFLRYADSAQLPYNVIEAFDQPWKRAQEGTVGGYWGIFNVHAQPKFPMQGPVTEEPRWWAGWLVGLATAGVFLLGALGRRRRCSRSAMLLAGLASGCAIAWQFRQMWFACDGAWEWLGAVAASGLALFTAWQLARWISSRLGGGTPSSVPSAALRFGWLFALTYYNLLLVFNGRYMDLPLGLFALPCVGYALVGVLGRQHRRMPRLEERFLAIGAPLLAIVMVVQEAGLTLATWSWLGLNLALALPVFAGWYRARQQPQQTQAADQQGQRA
jgi:glucan 1,3-beta-glucosidase